MDRDEAVKWLRLGYETLGPGGMSAIADAMGVSVRSVPHLRERGSGAATADGETPSTATHGGVILISDEQISSPESRFHQDHTLLPNSARSPLACPSVLPRADDPNWRPYVGDPWWFHCDYDGYLENRPASPDQPIAECFYDERGALVDDGHPYAMCRGTPNSYSESDPRHWLWMDPGGIWKNFGTLGESVRHRYDKNRQWLRERGHVVPPSAPPKAPFPY